jgi:formate--tetrahydrofolate ligase
MRRRSEGVMLPIVDVAARLGLGPDDLVPYGRDKAKLPLELLDRPRRGKLVLVTAITPTPAGEGKTTTTIGLVQGLAKTGRSACAALREPSLGPCFGVKGGGTGGGKLDPRAPPRTSTCTSPATCTRSPRPTT